ncbi:hypothetical protein DYB37_005096 [Aphanomyces astaci]|uniref:FAM86 N-terminal domain-containing protein n=2 Tax=Aphanomyces astaci TaxID=112090 RepID=A0A397BD10_APHAT|nr:hypothetical protein DYB25_004176 [Aphanomyces astaci]RHY42332.1 hypothetical protein DYB38_001801 [Aphanomyces astaci]RHY73078.1 hypothetical protein DYB30_002409 [Aphanomyces astaci]RHY97526.1 hypothetical protein DYB35_007090 [Aphanomyces astaci]RHZ19853.1 hypothetical protein DYB37_005096 [Aphanomyces astaci]
MASSDDEDWREEVEYAVGTIRVGTDLQFEIRQMEELSLAGSLSMLSEMRETTSEISGQRIWPGSYLLAEYVHANPDIVTGKRVLELGAGTGLVSLVARLAGATSAIATDGDLDVVTDILAWNVQNNAATNATLGSIDTTSLWWGDASSNEAFRDRFGSNPFDVIVAGDVLYKGELVPLLLSTVLKWMHTAHGTFFLCHIPRADVSHEVLQHELLAHGFSFEVVLDHAAIGTQDAARLPTDCAIDDVIKAKVYRIIHTNVTT